MTRFSIHPAIKPWIEQFARLNDSLIVFQVFFTKEFRREPGLLENEYFQEQRKNP